MWSLALRVQAARKLELSHTVSAAVTCAWPLRPEAVLSASALPFAEEPVLTIDRTGFAKQMYHLRCDAGTHIDAPSHHCKGGRSVAQLTAAELMAPLVVLHVQANVDACASGMYAVSLADLEEYECEHGRVPQGAVVAAATGWGIRYERQNTDGAYWNQGRFPGFSPELAAFLARERSVAGIMIDTLSGDVGGIGKFPVHDILLREHSKFIIENALLPGPDVLPPAGATLVALPLRIADAPEMSLRCIALIE